MTLPALVMVAGKRWPCEECHQQGKGQTGLDQHQVRTWPSFHRHTVLSMCAQALLAIAAARPAPPATQPPAASGTGQPEAWRDTGKLPAAADDQPPGDDPGLVKVSVPEARRLLRLATAPMSCAARDLGYAWSRWRRRHQARARWHHYHAQLSKPPASANTTAALCDLVSRGQLCIWMGGSVRPRWRRRDGGGEAGQAGSVVFAHPYRDVGGFQGLRHDAGQVIPDRVKVDGVLQAGRERGHRLVGVVPGPVEPPVHGALDAVAQRVEQRRNHECRSWPPRSAT